MTDDEWVALIGGMALVVGGILSAIGLLIKSTLDSSHLKDQVEQIRHEVKNSHDTNMRVELDQRHKEVVGRLDALSGQVTANNQRLSNLEEQVTEIRQSALKTAFDRIRHPLGGGSDKET